VFNSHRFPIAAPHGAHRTSEGRTDSLITYASPLTLRQVENRANIFNGSIVRIVAIVSGAKCEAGNPRHLLRDPP